MILAPNFPNKAELSDKIGQDCAFIGNFTIAFPNCIFQMSIEYFVLKSGRFLSLILLIIFLFLKYYQLPDPVAVYFDNNNAAAGNLPKSQFFYTLAAIIFGMYILAELILKICKKLFEAEKNYIVGAKEIKGTLIRETSENWINLISTCIHLAILVATMILAKLNSTEYAVTVANYSWFVIFLQLLLVLLLFYPFLKYLLAKPAN